MKVYRGYRFRIYPNTEQQEQFRKIFSAVRFTYNKLLLQWIRNPGVDLRAALSELLREYPWLGFINYSILTHAVSNLEKACRDNIREYGPLPPDAEKLLKTHDFGNPQTSETGNQTSAASSDDAEAAETQGTASRDKESTERVRKLPRFKTGKDGHASFTISSENNIFVRFDKLTLGGQSGLKPIRIVLSRPVPRGAHICSATISRNPAGHYHVSLLCGKYSDTDPDAWKNFLGFTNGASAVGLDYSLSSFFIASDSHLRPDERYLHNFRESRQKLAKAQRCLSRMQKGSRNYEKQRQKVAGIHEKIANQRRDYLNKLSTLIADRYDVVCVETLDLIRMEQFCHGFARRVQDNGWNDFVQMLEYKLQDRGKKLVKVAKTFPSSKRCHECSYIYRDLTLDEREWTCPVCGTHHNRDVNASLNIRDEGIRILLQQEKKAILSSRRSILPEDTFRVQSSVRPVRPEPAYEMAYAGSNDYEEMSEEYRNRDVHYLHDLPGDERHTWGW